MTPGKPDLRPPGTIPDQGADRAAGHRWLWPLLVIMLLAALAVVLYLPRIATFDQSQPEPVARDTPATAETPATTSPALEIRAEAQAVLRDYLQLRARLELENAAQWGEPEWSAAGAEAEHGDRFFGQHDYADARDAYRRGQEQLVALEASRPERLAAALNAASDALNSNDAATAIEHFESALVIDPANESALSGLERAQVRDEVLERMRAGNEAEGRADLEAAQTAYARAGQLDASYQQAAEALQRVTEQINDNRFRAAMGEAIAALEAGRYTESDKALDVAAQLRPDDAAVADTRQRLNAARKRSALAALRKQSAAQVMVEDWQAAARLYQRALKVDPGAGFAKEGLKQARERIRLHQQLDHYLSDPARLYADEPLANAEALLASAGAAPADEPKLATRIARLKRHVIEARTPILVQLRSDGETEVVIYHVGRRGRFQQQQLELRPGTYTAMGSRAGYRDVRKVFEVKPGIPMQPVVIQCEEPI